MEEQAHTQKIKVIQAVQRTLKIKKYITNTLICMSSILRPPTYAGNSIRRFSGFLDSIGGVYKEAWHNRMYNNNSVKVMLRAFKLTWMKTKNFVRLMCLRVQGSGGRYSIVG